MFPCPGTGCHRSDLPLDRVVGSLGRGRAPARAPRDLWRVGGRRDGAHTFPTAAELLFGVVERGRAAVRSDSELGIDVNRD